MPVSCVELAVYLTSVSVKCCLLSDFTINIFFFKALEVKVSTLTIYHKERKRELEEARTNLKEDCMDLDAKICVGMDFARCFLILHKCVCTSFVLTCCIPVCGCLLCV